MLCLVFMFPRQAWILRGLLRDISTRDPGSGVLGNAKSLAYSQFGANLPKRVGFVHPHYSIPDLMPTVGYLIRHRHSVCGSWNRRHFRSNSGHLQQIKL
jgi:hypothetical protein